MSRVQVSKLKDQISQQTDHDYKLVAAINKPKEEANGQNKTAVLQPAKIRCWEDWRRWRVCKVGSKMSHQPTGHAHEEVTSKRFN